MRVEFALIAAILVFCFWCAFILFNIETSVTMSNQGTVSGYNPSSSTSFHNLTPKLQYHHNQQQNYNYKHPINSYIARHKEQQQFDQQQATRNMPFWDTKIELDSQDPNNRTTLSQDLHRFPQERMRNNIISFPLTYLAANLPNSHIYSNKDYSSVSASRYNPPPGFQVDYHRAQGRRPERVGMVHKTVGLSSRIVPKETNLVSNVFELNSKLNSESDKSGSKPDNVDTDREDGDGDEDEEETLSDVKPEFRSNNNGLDSESSEHQQQQQQQQEGGKQAAEEEQEEIRRRSWQEEPAESKTGSKKSVKKINPATWNKQSRKAQILSLNRESEKIIPSGRGAGSKLEKKTPFNGDNKQFEQNSARIKSNDKKKSAKGIEDGFTSQKLTKAIGKLRANVSELNIGNRKKLIAKKLIKLRHPDRQIGMSKAKNLPKKEYHNHRVKESLTAQHWDDDASSPIEIRTKKPSTDLDYEPGAEYESEGGNDDDDDGDGENLNLLPSRLDEEDTKEEMEAEAETGPQQVAPELSELDLVEDPDQFMHASDRRKRDISDDETKTSFNDIMLSISKDSPIKASSKSVRDFVDIIERLGWIR